MINSFTSGIMLLALMACSKPVTYSIVIRNAALFDGHKDRGIVNIAISGDTIAEISRDKLVGHSVIDASGKYIIPGLVNAHVHASRIEDLREGFPLGILTLFNMHTGFEKRETLWKQISRDSAGYSTLYGAGYAATVPGGHPTQISASMETINDTLSPERWVDRRIQNGADYIKIVRENHSWFNDPAPPTLSYLQVREIIRYAHSKGMKAVVHASQAVDFTEIAKFKPDGFVHLWDFRTNSQLSESDYRTIAASGAFIVPTAGMTLKPKNPPPNVREWLDENMLSAEERAEVIKKFHSLGVLIVCGTDAQQRQMNFGDDFYYELDMYKKAGLSNHEVLQTATGNAARAFELPVGIIAVGMRADFVILDEDPLADLENLKKIHQVWKNGVPR